MEHLILRIYIIALIFRLYVILLFTGTIWGVFLARELPILKRGE